MANEQIISNDNELNNNKEITNNQEKPQENTNTKETIPGTNVDIISDKKENIESENGTEDTGNFGWNPGAGVRWLSGSQHTA